MWSALGNFIVALLIFAWNGLMLLTIATSPKLRRPHHILGANLWACNCITAVVTIFQQIAIGFEGNRERLWDMQCLNHRCVKWDQADHPMFKDVARELRAVGAHTAAVLLNNTVTLVSLFAIGVVHALSRFGHRLSRTACVRLMAAIWMLAVLFLLVDFFFARVMLSTIHAVPFHLSLLLVFLGLNLVAYMCLLVTFGWEGPFCPRRNEFRRDLQNPETQRLSDEAGTAALWLLLSNLSFMIVVLIIGWGSENEVEALEKFMGIEVAAFSIHCIANPLIAIIRDADIERAFCDLTHIHSSKPRTTEDELVVALMRDPPPPYEIRDV